MKNPSLNRSTASSGAYWTELVPDRASVLVHSVAASLAITVGGWALTYVNLPTAIRVLLVIAWLIYGLVPLARHLQARSFVRCLRFAGDGSLRIRLRRGDWIHATVREGSLVLRKAAWVRVRSEDGLKIDFLLIRGAQNGDAWRRFLVISRYVGRVS